MAIIREKKKGVTIMLIIPAPAEKGTRIFGLGSDQNIYAWHEGSGVWYEFWDQEKVTEKPKRPRA